MKSGRRTERYISAAIIADTMQLPYAWEVDKGNEFVQVGIT